MNKAVFVLLLLLSGLAGCATVVGAVAYEQPTAAFPKTWDGRAGQVGVHDSAGAPSDAEAAAMVDQLMSADPGVAAASPETTGSPAASPAASTPAAPVAPPAAAIVPGERRVALVIGNGDYSVSPLSNPPKDAKLFAEALRATGFQVALLVDADQAKMRRAIEKFGADLSGGGVGLFYFAGHGVQAKGRNYLIPIGANINSEGEVDIESVDISRVLAKMDSAKNRMNLVVLDACRNNPFARSFRSVNRGLAFVQAPQGTMIAYSTAPGDVAADGSGENSPYTTALVQHMKAKSVSVEEMFKAVRRDVQKTTGGKQTPWESSSLTGSFAFTPAN